MAGAATELARDHTKNGGDFGHRAALSLVDIGPLDRTAGEGLGPVNDVPQGVTVVRIIGHLPSVQHEQATGSTVIVVQCEQQQLYQGIDVRVTYFDLQSNRRIWAPHQRLCVARRMITGIGFAGIGARTFPWNSETILRDARRPALGR